MVTVESVLSKLAVFRIQLPGPKLTASAPPVKSTTPPKRAPGSTVRLSDCAGVVAPNWIAVPPSPMIVPELTRVPVVPDNMPMPEGPLPVIVPKLTALTLPLKVRMPAPLPVIAPEFVTIASNEAETPAECSPMIVPELVTVAYWDPMPSQ